ncbi:MAG: hypothetical protein KIS76_18650 [Pyrinomonadaceae bacterium]|nr:hypothetical protein [Pyrinomonadaceae bacterium]
MKIYKNILLVFGLVIGFSVTSMAQKPPKDPPPKKDPPVVVVKDKDKDKDKPKNDGKDNKGNKPASFIGLTSIIRSGE